jgi:D-galactarolactone cycloisomerase
MKITDVKTTFVEIPFDKGGFATTAAPDIIKKSDTFTLIEVFTDEDIIGIGVQDVHFPEWGKYIERLIKPILVEKIVEPTYVEKFAAYIREQPMGRSLSPMPCGVEIALWDAIGKKAGMPIYKMLGAYQDKVKAYVSVLEEYPPWNPKKWAEYTESIIKKGYKAIKLHIGKIWPDPQQIIEVVKTIRDFCGYDFDLMVDAMHAWEARPIYDLYAAIRCARGLEKYAVAWLEEPLPHLFNTDLCAQLCEAVDIPISGGGAMNGWYNFKTLLEKKALDIVQPDVQHVGGISEMKRIALLAEAYGRVFEPHMWGVGIALAATLQVIGGTQSHWLEYCYHPPYWTVEQRDCMLTEPLRIDKDGMVKIPDSPGLGVELNHEIIDKYTVK